MNVISPFTMILIWAPVILGGISLVWYSIRKHLWLNKEMREDEEEDRIQRDARDILDGSRLPRPAEVAALVVLLQENKRLIDGVSKMADRDPVVDLSLQDLRQALLEQSSKLEQRGIR